MTIPHTGSRPVRLVEPFRGSPAGCVLDLSPELARRLVEKGVAAYAVRDESARAVPERAVGQHGAEFRGGPR